MAHFTNDDTLGGCLPKRDRKLHRKNVQSSWDAEQLVTFHPIRLLDALAERCPGRYAGEVGQLQRVSEASWVSRKES